MRVREPPRGAQRWGSTQGCAPTGTRVALSPWGSHPGGTARHRQLQEAFLWGRCFIFPLTPP